MAEKKEAGVKYHVTSKVYKNYDVKGSSLERKNPTCPKCGSSVFMAKHKDRVHCGSCGYTEFLKKE